MKITAEDNYAEWVQCTIDGAPEHDAVEADEEAGSVLKLVPDGKAGWGYATLASGEYATQTVTGTVRLTLRAGAPTLVALWWAQQAHPRTAEADAGREQVAA